MVEDVRIQSQSARKQMEECEPTRRKACQCVSRSNVADNVPYLNLQDVVATDGLVVHLMVGVVSVPATLVLDKSEQSAGSAAGSRNVTADKTAVTMTVSECFLEQSLLTAHWSIEPLVTVFDLPFELVGKFTGTSAVAEASHVERGSAARHGRVSWSRWLVMVAL